MRRKVVSTLICAMIITSISASLTQNVGQLSSTLGVTIYVDDDNISGIEDGTIAHPYNTIQEGVDAASYGVTVYVFNGTYKENVIIDKSLILQGEDIENTLIDGGGIGSVVEITAPSVEFTRFKVQNTGTKFSDSGVKIDSNNNKVSDVFAGGTYRGVYVHSDNNLVKNIVCVNNGNYGIEVNGDWNRIINCITNNTGTFGIFIREGDHNQIKDSYSTLNHLGFQIMHGRFNKIENCTAINNNNGIRFHANVYNCCIVESSCINNGKGIILEMEVNNNTITGCLLENNGYGIWIREYMTYPSINNLIYHNIFNGNTIQAYDSYSNYWDKDYPAGGNYWYDYSGVDVYNGPNQDISGSDGIGDTPYTFSNGQDNYPLMNPVTNGNMKPVADAGSDQTVYIGEIVQFNGSGSYDPDGTINFYSWDFGDGTPQEIVISPSHIFNNSGNFTVILEVTDNNCSTDTDTCIINVLEENSLPIANAGPDQTVNEGDLVQFDGSGSYDPDRDFVFGPNIKINDDSTDKGQAIPKIAIDCEDTIHVVWADTRTWDTTRTDVYYANSTDGGISFNPNVRVNHDTNLTYQTIPVITVNENRTIFVAWSDNRDYIDELHPRGVRIAKSNDMGISFGPSTKITNYPWSGSIFENSLAIATYENDMVYVAWQDTRYANNTGLDICIANSTDGGETFGNPVRVCDEVLSRIEQSVSMDVALDGTIYVMWQGNQPPDTEYDIVISKSEDGGNSFSPDNYVKKQHNWGRGPSMAVDSGENIDFVWSDYIGGTINSYFARSTDGGISFGPSIMVKNQEKASMHNTRIALSSDDDIYVVLEYSNGEDTDIYFFYSTNNGSTFSTDIIVNNIIPEDQIWPEIAVDSEGNPHVVWTDFREGNADVYYSRALPVITYDWNFGDGTPHDEGLRPTHIYSNPGVYTVTLTVTDALGAMDSDTCFVTVLSTIQAPVANAGSDQTVNEGDVVLFDASASYDPDGTIEIYEWDFDASDGLWWESGVVPDATGPIPTTHIYGDDGIYKVTLRVTDNDNLSAIDTCNVTVQNVNPTVTIDSIIIDVEIGLRVAGRKYNNVSMTLYEDGSPLGYVSIERMPGSPNEQMAWIPVSINFSKSYNATVIYTPEDPPNIGGNPVWIYIKSKDGSINKIHHSFNVQQSKKRDSDHWNHVEPWEVDLNAHFIGLPFEITSHIIDPGSDDEILTFTYGSQNVEVTHFNNPPNPDPYPSPEVNPRDIYETVTLVYEGPGTVTLVAKDDDNIRIGIGQASDSIGIG